jgi:hypothetical protein
MPEVRFSLKLYRWFLKLYPAGFRETYAGPLERQFLDEMSVANGPFSLAMLWIHILSDLAVSLPLQFAREVTQDARHALRLWNRRPLQTGFAIAALAIGIGANTGVFSVVNALLLRSLPFRNPDSLIATHIFSPPHDTAKQFHDWRKAERVPRRCCDLQARRRESGRRSGAGQSASRRNILEFLLAARHAGSCWTDLRSTGRLGWNLFQIPHRDGQFSLAFLGHRSDGSSCAN